jgi:hypothetical protein
MYLIAGKYLLECVAPHHQTGDGLFLEQIVGWKMQPVLLAALYRPTQDMEARNGEGEKVEMATLTPKGDLRQK